MKKNLLIGLLAVLFVFTFSNCREGSSPLGIDLLNNQLGTDFTDTITLDAYSFLEDTVNTTKLSANLIGSLHDPVFGDCQATTYAQFTMGGSRVNFGESPVIDSVVLTIQISNYLGDTTSKVGIKVYELAEDIVENTPYYNNSELSHKQELLNYGKTSYSIQPHTSVIVDTNSYNPHLRIRLSQKFGQRLLDDKEALSRPAVFKEMMKGLCIKAESHTGNTGYMLITSMTSSMTGITLYYHNEKTKSKKYTFPCSSSCLRFTNFKHDYEKSSDNDFKQEVLQNNKKIGQEKLFLQAMSGVKTKITFPYLKDAFKCYDNKVVINKAELVICDIKPEEVFFLHPAGLSLQGIRKDTNAVSFIPDDEYYTSADFYGGLYDEKKHEYRFRITEYVQQQILGNSNLSNSLNLVVRGSGVRANRLVFGGPGLENDKRLRLEVTYTTF